MLYLFFVIILVLLLSLLMGYRNQYWLCFFSALCMAVLFSFSVDIPDYSAYKYFYDNNGVPKILFVNYDSSSLLFSYYAYILKFIGLNYDFFRLATLSIVCLTAYILLKNRIELGVLICAYAPCIFFFDLAQIRFFLSEFICFIAAFFLLKKNRVAFLLLLSCAIFIHSMNILWIFLLILPLDLEWNEKNLKKSLALIPCFFTVCLLSKPVIVFLQENIFRISFFSEYVNYMEVSVKFGFLLYLGYQLANVLLAIYVHYKMLLMPYVPLWHKRLNSLNYIVQIIGVSFVVMTMINVNFCRYFRMLYVLNMLNFASLIFIQEKNKILQKKICLSNKLANVIMFFLLTGIWVFGETNINHAYVSILTAVDKYFPSFF